MNKSGCLLLAGGEGSRFGHVGPKGTFPVLDGKSLFELLCKQIRNAPLAVMTSPLNDAATRAFFAQNSNFGLSDVFFFSQAMLPLLDEERKPLPLMAPDGNGGVFHRFCEKGIDRVWKESGITHVHVVLIDNPLAEPCDPKRLEAHINQGADWSVVCVERKSRDEKVGVVLEEKRTLRIVEYSDLPADFDPPRALANTGTHLLDLDLISDLSKIDESTLPIHLAKKRREEQSVLKQERFIFDLLPFARHPKALLFPREEVFAPLKRPEDLPVVQDLLKRKQNRGILH